MANFQEFNIFDRAPVPFTAALPVLAAAKSFALPVAGETAGDMSLHTLIPLLDGGRARLQAFTEEAALTTPFIKYQPLETALIFFHAPAHDSFSFDPGHAKTTSVNASRAEISLLAGCLQAGGAAKDDPSKAAAAEFSLGNLHKAHYFCSLEQQRTPASRLQLCAVLAELGLYQEAYDALKEEKAPEALLLLASIHRRTGNPQRAAEALAAIAGGTPAETGKAAEAAWLNLAAGREDEAEKEFERLAAAARNRAEALSGLGAARAKKAFRTNDSALLASATAALESALAVPSPSATRIFFQLGNIYFRSGNLAKAELCYRRTAARSPGVQALANLAATLIRSGKPQEARALTARIALTDPAAARQLASTLQGEKAPQAGGLPVVSSPVGGKPAPEFKLEAFPAAPPPPPAHAQPPLPSALPVQASLDPAITLPRSKLPAPGPAAPRPGGVNFESTFESAQVSPAPLSANEGQASLEPAAPRNPLQAFAGRTGGQPSSPEAMQEIMRGVPDFSSQERRPEDFMSGAFRLASTLEREYGGKVHFNREGLSTLEAKLRSAFVGGKSQAGIELAIDSAAFLCYFLQERHKGRLVKLQGFEPWGWPMIFEADGRKITTYPAQRPWRLVWGESAIEPGWLINYSDWLTASLQKKATLPSGAPAVKDKIASHQERIIDAETEHKRILLLAAGIPELAGIEPERSGLYKLGAAIRKNFRPKIPPSADGWRLLRCCGHLLAQILEKEFKASWFNTDGSDGSWSMRLPWGTFVFPLGKAYKAALSGDDLGDYYSALFAERKSRQ
ncbi:MAG TPA: hypothetical protein PKI19_03950 [Elusimicrobiales bacterium]|nr:hypothetical protein [Elusimicrobiales bacterium]